MAASDKKAGTMKYDEWISHWGKDDAPFHWPEPDEILVKKEAEILGDKTRKVFVPCCGKSEDLNWLYNKGHTVVGVEISEKACSDFFKEHKIEPDVEAIANVGNVYKTKDKRIQLYAANIFNVTADMAGTFDVVWDSAGLSVINKEDRPRYFKLMKSLMTPDTLYFITGADYDKSVWPGPPHPLNVTELTEMCGDTFNIELFHQMDAREGQSNESQEDAKPSDGTKDEPQGGTNPPDGAKDEGKDNMEFNFDDVEDGLNKSAYMYYTYHRLTQK